MMGKQKAAVFPEPVCAHAIRSPALEADGDRVALHWSGLGVLAPLDVGAQAWAKVHLQKAASHKHVSSFPSASKTAET